MFSNKIWQNIFTTVFTSPFRNIDKALADHKIQSYTIYWDFHLICGQEGIITEQPPADAGVKQVTAQTLVKLSSAGPGTHVTL